VIDPDHALGQEIFVQVANNATPVRALFPLQNYSKFGGHPAGITVRTNRASNKALKALGNIAHCYGYDR
jgi:hypothetical protein